MRHTARWCLTTRRPLRTMPGDHQGDRRSPRHCSAGTGHLRTVSGDHATTGAAIAYGALTRGMRPSSRSDHTALRTRHRANSDLRAVRTATRARTRSGHEDCLPWSEPGPLTIKCQHQRWRRPRDIWARQAIMRPLRRSAEATMRPLQGGTGVRNAIIRDGDRAAVGGSRPCGQTAVMRPGATPRNR